MSDCEQLPRSRKHSLCKFCLQLAAGKRVPEPAWLTEVRIGRASCIFAVQREAVADHVAQDRGALSKGWAAMQDFVARSKGGTCTRWTGCEMTLRALEQVQG